MEYMVCFCNEWDTEWRTATVREEKKTDETEYPCFSLRTWTVGVKNQETPACPGIRYYLACRCAAHPAAWTLAAELEGDPRPESWGPSRGSRRVSRGARLPRPPPPLWAAGSGQSEPWSDAPCQSERPTNREKGQRSGQCERRGHVRFSQLRTLSSIWIWKTDTLNQKWRYFTLVESLWI